MSWSEKIPKNETSFILPAYLRTPHPPLVDLAETILLSHFESSVVVYKSAESGWRKNSPNEVHSQRIVLSRVQGAPAHQKDQKQIIKQKKDEADSKRPLLRFCNDHVLVRCNERALGKSTTYHWNIDRDSTPTSERLPEVCGRKN